MIKIHVDATRALAKFSPAGIPESVRNNLRKVIPDLTKSLGVLAERKLAARTKSQNRIQIKKEMVEDRSQIIGRVRAVWTGEQAKALVPFWLETGTRPHKIEARNASVLAFFWPQIGGMFFGKSVQHPGTAPIYYMRDSLSDMTGEIQTQLHKAVIEGANQV